MNIHDLRIAQAQYENRIVNILKDQKPLYQLRSKFVSYFNLKRIGSMSIDDYAIGSDLPAKGFNFCYGLERQLDGLGSILGATAFKFGVYYGRTKKSSTYKYRFAKKYGKSYKTAFENIKESILRLIDDGKNKNLVSIIENNLSPMFKAKILTTYFPNVYLNIFSSVHLDYFLIQLDLDDEELINAPPVYKREALVKFKNRDSIMKKWSIDLFATFLYTEYPGTPVNRVHDSTFSSTTLNDYQNPSFPPNPAPIFIDLYIIPPNLSSPGTTLPSNSTRKKTNYEKAARKLKQLGDRGEKIVLELEKNRLINLGKKDLAKKIKRVSLKSDSFGYDILSFEKDGRKRFIEVKATQSKVGPANFFYTANELRTAQESDNYFIYMVYNVTSQSPKVWAIKNPFNPSKKSVIKSPINYKVTINASKG